MNDNVVNFPVKMHESVSAVLDLALREDLDRVVVVGETKEGEYYLGSSVYDPKHILWLIEILKKELMEYEP